MVATGVLLVVAVSLDMLVRGRAPLVSRLKGG
jgi:hypothetical protein